MPQTIDLEKLRKCIMESKNIKEMCQIMGYKTFSSQLRKAVIDNHIDISHLPVSYKYLDDISDEDLRQIVSRNHIWRHILNECGYRSYKGLVKIKEKCQQLGIDVSHIDSIDHECAHKGFTLDQICIENSWYSNCKGITRRLLNELKWERKCSACNLSEWLGKPIPLELHHINGKHFDHRLENLRLLCPNCHAQTDNYCRKTRRREERGLLPKITPKPKIKIAKVPREKKNKCQDCGIKVRSGIKRCLDCYHKASRRVERPPYEQLKKDIEELNYTHTAEKYHVSDKCIRKWVKYYEIAGV